MILLAALFACSADIPEGRFSCTNDTECPPEWRCASDGRCYSMLPVLPMPDASLDAAGDERVEQPDAAASDTSTDGGSGVDAIAPVDAALDAPAACVTGVVDGTYADLAMYEISCDGARDATGARCIEAIDDLCRVRGCSAGVGPVEHAVPMATWICVARATELAVPSSMLTAPCGTSAESGQACLESAHRICQGREFAAGYGPVGFDAGMAVLRCFDIATVEPRAVAWTELARFNAYCDGASERYGERCTSAAHRECLSHGYRGGYGPVLGSGSLATTVCVR